MGEEDDDDAEEEEDEEENEGDGDGDGSPGDEGETEEKDDVDTPAFVPVGYSTAESVSAEEYVVADLVDSSTEVLRLSVVVAGRF